MFNSDATVVRTVRRLLTHRAGPRSGPGRTSGPDTTAGPNTTAATAASTAEPDLSAGLGSCPGCGEQVHVYAVRCRHCGHDIEQRAG